MDMARIKRTESVRNRDERETLVLEKTTRLGGNLNGNDRQR